MEGRDQVSYIGNRLVRRRRVIYVPRAAKVVKGKPSLHGLGGLADDIFGTVFGLGPAQAIANVFTQKGEDPSCIAQADAATAKLDATWQNIAQNWNPTGNFSPTDMDNAISMVVKTLSDAQVALQFAPPSTADSGDVISQALGDINTKLQQMAPYAQAVTNAKASGASVINSPNFKTWITTSLVVASAAFATRAVLDCNVSWMDKAQQWFDQVSAVVMKIVDVVITAGETAIDVVGDAFDLMKYIKWGALAVGAYWLYTKFKKPAHA